MGKASKLNIAAGVAIGRIPFTKVGSSAPQLVVINGGQGFVRRSNPERQARDAGRVARILPMDTTFVLLGYDPAPPADLSIDAIVADMAAAIGEVAPQGPVALAGISYGGMIASRLAASHPHLVDRLLLVASADRFSAEGERHVRAQIDSLESGDLAAFVSQFTCLFRRWWMNKLVGFGVRLARRRLPASMAPTEIVVRHLRLMLEAGPAPLERITVSTLIVGGSADQFFGDGIMEAAAARISAAEAKMLAGETHMAPMERAADFRAAIGAFLND